MKINYAIYGKIIDKNPLIRCNTLEDARAELTNSDDGAIIVCEVSEIQQDGSLLITQERVVKSPQIWLPADRFIPEYDGYFLCYLFKQEECGSFIRCQEVINFSNLKWQKRNDAIVTHFIIVENPL